MFTLKSIIERWLDLMRLINKKVNQSYIRNLDLYIAVAIPLLILFIYNYIPMIGIVISFMDFNPVKGIAGSPWVGMQHFKSIFANPKFFSVLGNTLIINFYKLIFQFPVPLILALLLNELKNIRFKRMVQSFTYLPHFLSWVVLSAIFIDILSPSTGIVNIALKALGFEPVSFLGNSKTFRGVLVVTQTWKEMGWSSIIYLAAISAVNSDLYEAAGIDGAGRIKQMLHVTLPGISSTIVFILMLRVGYSLGSDTEQVLLLYSPLVMDVGDVLGTYIYREGLVGGQYSRTTAVGLFISLVGFMLISIANVISKRNNLRGLW